MCLHTGIYIASIIFALLDQRHELYLLIMIKGYTDFAPLNVNAHKLSV